MHPMQSYNEPVGGNISNMLVEEDLLCLYYIPLSLRIKVTDLFAESKSGATNFFVTKK